MNHSLLARERARALVALFTILLIALAVRLPHLADAPRWDADEGYNYSIAYNLLHGRAQMFALRYAFVQHPPGFYLIAAAAFRVLGPSLGVLRLVTVLFSLATLLILPLLVRELAWRDHENNRLATPLRIGLLAALLYAVLPLVVVQNRFAYTYTALSFWTMLALIALMRARRSPGWPVILLGGIATGTALATDQEGVYLLPLLLLISWRLTWPQRVIVWGAAALPPGIYILFMWITERTAFLFDLAHTATRVGGGSVATQTTAWIAGATLLILFDLTIPLGLVGFIIGAARERRGMGAVLVTSMLFVIIKVRAPNPYFRAAEPLLPIVCIGLAFFLHALWPHRLAERSRGTRILLLSLAGTLIVTIVGYDIHGEFTRLPTAIDRYLAPPAAQAQAVASWLNRRIRSGDVTIIMPQLSPLIHGRTTEFLQVIAYTGRASAFYPAHIPGDRWAYHIDLADDRFFVLDEATRSWLDPAQTPHERSLILSIMSSWRRVYTLGQITVYENRRAANGR